MENESGSSGPLPGRFPASGAGAGPYSAAINRILFVFRSSVIVFALGMVCTVCSTTKLVWTILLDHRQCPIALRAMNASMVPGLKAAPSTPCPMV